MVKELEKYFVKDGVYKLNMYSTDTIFVCMPAAGFVFGKLVQYNLNEGIYEKTQIAYFLNSYNEDDIKSLFLKRENYEMLGMLGQNYVMSEDGKQIIRG